MGTWLSSCCKWVTTSSGWAGYSWAICVGFEGIERTGFKPGLVQAFAVQLAFSQGWLHFEGNDVKWSHLLYKNMPVCCATVGSF